MTVLMITSLLMPSIKFNCNGKIQMLIILILNVTPSECIHQMWGIQTCTRVESMVDVGTMTSLLVSSTNS